MIMSYNLKAMLLKAMNLRKDHSHQVLVERIETNKNGTTYRHKHWVNPDQVKSTDKVLRGHHNLPKGHPQKLNPTTAGRLSQHSKNVVNSWSAQFPGPHDIIPAMEKMDIPWNKQANPATNLMWAKMGLRAAIDSGFDLNGTWEKIKNTVANAVQPSTPQAPSTSNNQSTSTSTTSSKVVYTKAVKDKTKAFYNTFNSKQDFYDALNKMGITVVQYNDPGITLMRAKMAVNDMIVQGKDPFTVYQAVNSTSAQDTESNSNTPSTSIDQSTPDSPNKPSDNSTELENPPEPVKDPNAIEAPENATPEQLEYIKHINKMTDVDDIKRCTVLGIVPEDIVIQKYLTNVSYEEMVKAYERKGTAKMAVAAMEGFRKDVEDLGLKLKGSSESIDTTYQRQDNLVNVMADLRDKVKPKGIDFGCFKDLPVAFAKFNMSVFTNPAKYISEYEADRAWTFDGLSPTEDFLNHFHYAYSDYATDEYDTGDITLFGTNVGYTGFDTEEYKKRYDLNKEGFVRYLNKLADSTTDKDIKEKAQQMIQSYGSMMQLVGTNHALLDTVLKSDCYSASDLKDELYDYGEIMSRSNFSGISELGPGVAKGVYKDFHGNAEKLATVLAKYCKDTESVAKTLSAWRKGQTHGNVIIRDKDNNVVRTVDLYEEHVVLNTREKVTEQPLEKSEDFSAYVAYLTCEKLGEKVQYNKGNYVVPQEVERCVKLASSKPYPGLETLIKNVELLKEYSEISFDDYKTIHGLANSLMGKHLNLSNLQASSSVNVKDYVYSESDPATEFILSNAALTVQQIDLNKRVVSKLRFNPSDDDLNKLGKDYSGNFNYYSSSSIRFGVRREKTPQAQSAEGSFESPKQVSDQITKQLNQTRVYSPEYINSLQRMYQLQAKLNKTTPDIEAKNDVLGNTKDLTSETPKPIFQIFVNSMSDIFHYVPEMNKAKFDLQKTLGYSGLNPEDEIKKITDQQDKKTQEEEGELKAYRQKLFEKATCTVHALPPKESDDFQKDLIENRFDYKPGEKSPDGATYKDKVHKGRRIFFNTPIFHVRNTKTWEGRYNKSKQSMINHKAKPEAYEDINMFHGTKKWCLGGIIGRDQGWYMGREAESAGKMLGAGAYFGYKLGKSTVYAGDDIYSNLEYGTFEDNDNRANGVIIMAKVMRGTKHSIRRDIGSYHRTHPAGSDSDMAFTSLATNPEVAPNMNDHEMVIKRNENICVEYFVDVSCRHIYKNIAIDEDGNYYENNDEYQEISRKQREFDRDHGKNAPGRPVWNGDGYKPKWDKNCKLIGMDELPE